MRDSVDFYWFEEQAHHLSHLNGKQRQNQTKKNDFLLAQQTDCHVSNSEIKKNWTVSMRRGVSFKSLFCVVFLCIGNLLEKSRLPHTKKVSWLSNGTLHLAAWSELFKSKYLNYLSIFARVICVKYPSFGDSIWTPVRYVMNATDKYLFNLWTNQLGGCLLNG